MFTFGPIGYERVGGEGGEERECPICIKADKAGQGNAESDVDSGA
jgi:hypothetical protein